MYYYYRLDALLEEEGHVVLRLPPYHPQLNPIELIWATVKNWVAAHNTTFRMCDVEKLAREKFKDITVQEWKNICHHVKKIENEMMEKEGLIDDITENFSFTINTGSSEEGWSDNEGEATRSGFEISSDTD